MDGNNLVTKPLLEEEGPEPTIGKKSNYALGHEILLWLYLIPGAFFFAVFLYYIIKGGTDGITFNGIPYTAEKWIGSDGYNTMLIVIIVSLIDILFNGYRIINRHRAKKNKLSGIVVGFKRSAGTASNTNHMDLTVETTINGNKEYARVRTYNGKYTKSCYKIGQTVTFYKLGKCFYVNY